MSEYAVAAMGTDRPGIVAAVSKALHVAGASIEDSSMTILGGHFAMLLLVRGDLSQQELEHALEGPARELDLMLEVRETAPRHDADGDRGSYVVAAYGPDQPGLVAPLAQVLAGHDANITDFGSRLGEAGVFAMWFNVTLPASVDTDALTQQLARAGGEVSLDVTVHPADADAL